jgi:hypothetical protein
MDDVFQILIYLLIIISFIAPIFKKKNQNKNSQPSPRQRSPLQNDILENSKTEIAVTESKQTDYDVLKELENFFKVGSEEKTGTADNQNINYEGQQPEPQIVPKLRGYQSIWDKKKAEVESVVKSLDKKIEDQAKQFQEETAYQKKSLANDFAIRLKKNIREPATLKEYILFAEIIGKPKSLRR